jgi:hypothetical protein
MTVLHDSYPYLFAYINGFQPDTPYFYTHKTRKKEDKNSHSSILGYKRHTKQDTMHDQGHRTSR